MRKPGYSFLAGVLCFTAIYVGLWALGWMIEAQFKRDFGGSEVRVIANSTSSNQQHVATTYTDMGGGAAGWCYHEVNVRKNDEPFDSQKGDVFYTGCNSEIDLIWKDDGNLLITYSSDGESASLHQKTWSSDKAVRISYAAK